MSNLKPKEFINLAHSALPKHPITISSGNEASHLFEFKNSLNLKCEDFYNDFKATCEEVISMNFLPNDKMNKNFLSIPSPDNTYILSSGSTR